MRETLGGKERENQVTRGLLGEPSVRSSRRGDHYLTQIQDGGERKKKKRYDFDLESDELACG